MRDAEAELRASATAAVRSTGASEDFLRAILVMARVRSSVCKLAPGRASSRSHTLDVASQPLWTSEASQAKWQGPSTICAAEGVERWVASSKSSSKRSVDVEFATRRLVRVVEWCSRNARLTAVAGVVLGAAAFLFTADHFALSSDTAGLISPKLDWRQREIAFDRAFPGQGDPIVVVIDAATPELAGLGGRPAGREARRGQGAVSQDRAARRRPVLRTRGPAADLDARRGGRRPSSSSSAPSRSWARWPPTRACAA